MNAFNISGTPNARLQRTGLRLPLSRQAFGRP